MQREWFVSIGAAVLAFLSGQHHSLMMPLILTRLGSADMGHMNRGSHDATGRAVPVADDAGHAFLADPGQSPSEVRPHCGFGFNCRHRGNRGMVCSAVWPVRWVRCRKLSGRTSATSPGTRYTHAR